MKRLFIASLFAGWFAAETAVAGWTVQNFDKANYGRPENALSGTRSKNVTKEMADGDISTYGGISQWYDYGMSFPTPKDITEVRIYPVGGGDAGNTRPDVARIRVKYWGDETIVDLDSTGFGFKEDDYLTDDCIQMIFTPASDFVAKRVSYIDVVFSGVKGDFRVAEIEFLGSDSFVPEIQATYLIGNARLNTSVTVKARAYPALTSFCYGETDGGEELSAWDHVVEAGSATALEIPFEEHRTVDFKYCRYYLVLSQSWGWNSRRSAA